MRLANLADELAEDASDAVSSDSYFTKEARNGRHRTLRSHA
jgi:hypothetical protein